MPKGASVLILANDKFKQTLC